MLPPETGILQAETARPAQLDVLRSVVWRHARLPKGRLWRRLRSWAVRS